MIAALVQTGQARFEYRHYLGHFGSEAAASAMECAADQRDSAFWQVHDELMVRPGTVRDESRLTAFAAEIGLDTEQFISCIDDRIHIDRIRAEHNAARAAGVRLTPTIFVNESSAGITLGSITRAVEAATP